MKYIYLIVFITLNAFPTKDYAQTSVPATNAPQVVPLSPNAAEFAKYGNIPVSPSTGVPSINIPLYEINTGKIKVPISISYHASGIQVDQKATWIGLGWSLNAGGIISRSVRGIPDELINGWMNEVNTSSTISNSSNPTELGLYADNTYDAQPDFFNYNMPALSGRFIYSQSTSSFQTIPTEPVKIVRIVASGGADVDNTFQITDVDGTNYYFQEKQTYFNDSGGPNTKYVQSWYLTRIVSADLKDTVQFNYTTVSPGGGSSEELSESEVHTYSTDDGASNSTIPANSTYIDKGTVNTQSYFYHSYIVLKEIVFRQGKVEFDANTLRRDYLGAMLDGITVYNKLADGSYNAIYKYQLNHDYFTTAQPLTDQYDYRLRLNSISKVAVNSNTLSETHQFIYNPMYLPSINSKSVDYWGFYNGVTGNTYLPNILPSAPELASFSQNNLTIGGGNRNESDDFIQAGMLQKIIYPTGGFTVFTFQPHEYTSDQTQTQTQTVALANLTGVGKKTVKTTNTTFSWPSGLTSNTGAVTVTLTPTNNPGAFDAPQRITLTDLTTNNAIGVWEHQGDLSTRNVISTSFVFNPTHNYQITLLVQDDAPTSVSFSLTGQVNQTTTTTKHGGGLRIGSIQNFDNKGTLASTEKYSYSGATIGKNDNLIANNYIKRQLYKSINIGNTGCTYYVYYSINYYGTPGYSGQNFEGSNVVYSSIIKSYYDNNNLPNGRTNLNYQNARSFASILNPTMPGGKEYIDNSLGRPNQLASEEYDKSNPDGSYTPLKLKVYSYGGPISFTEPLQQITRNYTWITQTQCLADNVNTFSNTPYNINIGTLKPTAMIETDYSGGSPVVSSTQYSYGNPTHLQITQTVMTGSDGKTILIQNKYPADYSDNTYSSNLLRGQAINNAVLEQTTTKNNALVLKTAVNYRNSSGSIVPDYVMKALTNGTLEPRLKYNQYDNNGNIADVAQFDGTNSFNRKTYLWGYNYTYPIAEISNTDYATVSSILSSAGINPDNVASQPLVNSTDLSTIRNAIQSKIPNALITTYTYAPLVGMTSSTDAKGITTYYEYDSFQRLMNIKDKDGNIVKHMDYHYQGQ